MNWTKHPILKTPSRAQLEALLKEKGPQAVYEVWKAREDAIQASRDYPIEHGFVLEHQQKVEDLLHKPEIDEVWVFGGWRSGKSRSAAKIVVEAAVNNPNAEIICWAQNEDASVERQQPYIYEMLPPEFKVKMKDSVAKINYSKGTGFAGKKCILPNGAVIYFKFYTQFQNNDTMLEGANLGALSENVNAINIGSWLDEYLGDETLIERVRGRCSEKNSKILVTFTPVDGYTSCVGSIMDGAKTIESKPASLLDGKHMPTVQKPKSKDNAMIVFYHTEDNPWANFDRLSRDLRVKPEADIKKLAYGFPTKSRSAMFSTFDLQYHVYDPDKEVYDFTKQHLWTVYQIIDPAGARSWCNGWIAVNGDGQWRAFAEFPDRETCGEWAVEGRSGRNEDAMPTWKPGPAAKDYAGLSFAELKIEWQNVEGKIPVFERIIDSRFAHNPRATQNDGMKTLQGDLADAGIETVASDGGTEDDGLAILHQLLAIPEPNKPFDLHTNCPRLRFSKNCGNWIFSMMNYAKNGKKDEALKDFIDLCRYAARHDKGEGIQHYTHKSFATNLPTRPMY
jgi:hypothetical protein